MGGGAHLPFELFVRTPSEIVLQLEVKPSDTIEEVKARLATLEGTPVERQRLLRQGAPLPDKRSLEACGVAAGTVLLLVPRMQELGQRNVPLLPEKPLASGIPRPRIPLVCTDIARPFPMSLEFVSISEYQSFMLSLQRQVGKKSLTSTIAHVAEVDERAPYLEILSLDNMRPPVQTRVTFDEESEVLLIDTVGDILVDNVHLPRSSNAVALRGNIVSSLGQRVPLSQQGHRY
ncbi:unnamed protein product [Durusdinium trenchii]|uniref:Ubiquitin-like domain-containing protein n=1 Tax=Durusdinium trenchii TaxID=1381693 RepID=A0ABP0PAI5_9DINO